MLVKKIGLMKEILDGWMFVKVVSRIASSQKPKLCFKQLLIIKIAYI
jgi:hypothetical protein